MSLNPCETKRRYMMGKVQELKVQIKADEIESLKRSISQDIAKAIEAAYREGWTNANTEIEDIEIDYYWNHSDTKKKLDNFLKC